MKRLVVLVLLWISGFSVIAQNGVKITYDQYFNDQLNTRGPKIVSMADNEKTLFTNTNILEGKSSFPAEQTLFFPKKRKLEYHTRLSDGRLISGADSLKYKYELLDDNRQILGYDCKKAKTIINSNTIEIWYTDQLPYFNSPTPIGTDLGTVLETIRNGNTVTRAAEIRMDAVFPDLPESEPFDLLTYRDLIWKSRFLSLQVFDHELINWNPETKSKEGVMRFANGTMILKKVKFPEIGDNKQIFVELKQRSNGDAYDRTGSVFVIPEGRETNFFDGLQNGLNTLPALQSKAGNEYQGYVLTDAYLPNVELMRFFTSFGVGHFNYNQIKGKDWLDFTTFRQEITDLKPVISGKELYVGTYIGNYDGGGHEVSLEITIHDGGNAYHNFNYALPILNTVNVMEMDGQNYSTIFEDEKGIEVSFVLDKDLKNAKLKYITTGHGGWGNGDEFVPKSNKIFLDQLLVHSFTPWRQDCGSYRLSNPISGNFNSGLSSSDLSRSNWCPATVTNPVFIDLGDLKAGSHSIRVQIPQGQREGSSFSFWNVSGVLLGELQD